MYDISNISYQYRPGLPYVIKQLSFNIQENQKIGVVGRTGSGKSTLTLGLLRIIELARNENVIFLNFNYQSNFKGSIVLDKINIEEIGLHELRKKITIIP